MKVYNFLLGSIIVSICISIITGLLLIELGIDKGVLQYNGGLMLKSGFIE